MNEGQPMQYPIVMMAPQVQQQAPQSMDDPPARVLVAMRFLSELTFKQMTRVAVADMGRIEEIAPPGLNGSEVAAQHAACDMLESYFAGRLKPNLWEDALIQEKTRNPQEEGTLLRCIACQGANPQCSVCKGTGRILIYPAKEGP